MFSIETIKLPKNTEFTPYGFAQEMVEYQGKMKCIGSGCYASVYSDEKHSHVYKISEDSAYLEFIKMLSKQTKPNPYFPVIHAARLIKDHKYHGGAEILVVCMERLHKLGNCAYPYKAMQHIVASKPKEVESLCKMFGLNADLSEALYQLSFLCSSKSLYVDLHDHNVMLRDKQLVFTDPFVI